jgi:hypothetical protein
LAYKKISLNSILQGFNSSKVPGTSLELGYLSTIILISIIVYLIYVIFSSLVSNLEYGYAKIATKDLARIRLISNVSLPIEEPVIHHLPVIFINSQDYEIALSVKNAFI